ncbi:N-acetylmuramoyl-L-alanine amidase family protein [Paenibacillus pinihumi]|uniref:N-acetylmuramoyl-L-alanine amidase family protein n=1 Tax=Paenibacillus pinihumi TaxID=669462 RepID=UPI001FE071B5|nr:N-acetylmuramoyl-L-alanine amidase [Paenibacillus pinihumi]
MLGLALSGYALFSSLISASRELSASETGTPQLTGKKDEQARKSDGRHIIVIDAGHGGKDPGAEGVSGKYERAYTLSLTMKIAALLDQEPMFEPHMTRTDDTFIGLTDRARMANELHADAFISVHGNTFPDPDIAGTESYYYADDSIRLANTIHQQLIQAAGFKDRGVKMEGWWVLKKSEVPAILLEIGFLTNRDEEAAMLSDAHQSKVAQAIVDGLKQYFSTKK